VEHSVISVAGSAKKRSSIVISVDLGRSLSEYLSDIGEVGYLPSKLTDNFYAMELDVQNEIEYRWKEFETILSLIPGLSFKDANAEDVAFLPGMDTLALLLKLDEIGKEKKYEYVQIHFPSSEKMLDFVMLPLNGEWFYQTTLPEIKNMLKLAKLVRSFIKMPDPDFMLSKINEYHSKLENIAKLVTDVDTTSARFDMDARYINAGKTTFASLSLFGINVDGVFTASDFDFASKRIIVKDFYDKPKDIEALGDIASELFEDPADIFRKTKLVKFDKNALEIQLDYINAPDMSVYQSKGQLAIKYKGLKRTIILPPHLRGKNVENAKISDGKFTVQFS